MNQETLAHVGEELMKLINEATRTPAATMGYLPAEGGQFIFRLSVSLPEGVAIGTGRGNLRTVTVTLEEESCPR
jgi:hypothetical protein